MGLMTVPQFSRPGAIDLSALRPPQPAPGGQPGAGGPPGAFTLDVTSEEMLRRDVVEQSLKAVVIVSFWSPEAPVSTEINEALTTLSDEYAGQFLFAKVDVSANPALAQALQIPSVPLVVAAIRGQLAPLIQDALPLAEMRTLVSQVLQAAAQSGVTGRVEPRSGQPLADVPTDEQEEPPARYPDAEAALMSGDLETAVDKYQKALAGNPGDDEASLGLAQAKLLLRTRDVDAGKARQAAEAAPDDVSAQTLVADLDILDGRVDDGFQRLIELVRRTTGDDRDRARLHLVELFAVIGNDDERVTKARQLLASALF
jgi:putative thioredoxin